MDIVIGELLTRQRLIGDRRLSDALAECDAKGWDARVYRQDMLGPVAVPQL